MAVPVWFLFCDRGVKVRVREWLVMIRAYMNCKLWFDSADSTRDSILKGYIISLGRRVKSKGVGCKMGFRVLA